jgi:hypothetical protein
LINKKARSEKEWAFLWQFFQICFSFLIVIQGNEKRPSQKQRKISNYVIATNTGILQKFQFMLLKGDAQWNTKIFFLMSQKGLRGFHSIGRKFLMP